MKHRHFFGFCGAVILTGVLVSCGRQSEELRYRLTVEVETPKGLKTGSSVIEVRGVKNPAWVTPEGRGTRSSFRGEAVAVDLPGGRTLFALLRSAGGGSDAADYPWLAFRDRLKDSRDWLESMRLLRKWEGQVAAMPPTERVMGNGGSNISALPLLVAFADTADPKSIERVDPQALDTVFGSHIRLRRITIEVTRDDMTRSIDKRLNWLNEYNDRMLDGHRLNDSQTLANNLTPLAFKR